MKTIIHKANSRGHANHGWLNTYHSFSFASYYDPERIHFGALRVLNDDTIAAGKGFGTHPHDNMEIITLPLSGDLKHKDSMGNERVIKNGDLQVMSAGSGIEHSEFNASNEHEVQLLQIWLFPNKKNVEPRYDQISLQDLEKENELFQILSPEKKDQGVWIHQDAWFHLGNLLPGWEGSYTLKGKNHGVYIFVIEGTVSIENNLLNSRDGMGISAVKQFSITTHENSRLLLMEVPMQIR
ncbi:MAG: pirin family protein [Bacteroidales bacterium]|jgi:redox-sensitive bicupin YhaK (pirin superfamily)|nr:pirin family protein [Bacteroidales bacterium]